jgi:tetratricopeptide (TPR) repeat protein
MNEHADTAMRQGRHCHASGDLAGALVCYEQAQLAAPDDPAPQLARGVVLHELERFAEAVACYDALLQQFPRLGEGWHNRGNSLLAMGNYAEAVASYERAVSLIPDDLDALVASGTALERLGCRAAAMARYRAVLGRDPKCAEAHWNLALALLAEGEYLAGWREFVWRWRKKGYTSTWRNFPQPLWDGGALDAGKTILLHAEQAYGDTLQFVRYVPLVARAGGRVILECPAPLVTLLAEVAGVAQVVASGQPLPHFDCHLPLMSLPGIFQTTVATIPREIPYLRVPVERRDRWRRLVVADQSFKVGLVWEGRRWPDPFRSCRLDDLAPLAAISGITCYSLQIGSGQEQAAAPPDGLRLVDLTADIHDFADTAAVISNLDLVVSIDTAVAHLAGGLGKPVFLLAPFAPDWRWCSDDQRCAWYPSMTLFRQERLGSWREPVLQLQKAVRRQMAAVGSARQIALPDPPAVPQLPLRIYCYRADVDYLLTPANRYPNIPLVPLADALANGHPGLVPVSAPDEADFIVFPEYLDALLDNVGVAGTRQFIRGLPCFAAAERKHIFFTNHDNAVPFGLEAVFFQVSINRHDHDPYAVAVPYPAQWISERTPEFDLEKMRYLVSFNGNIASSLLRAELVLAVLKEPRLSVYADPVPGFHCHLSFEQQVERKARYLQTLNESLLVLCPRGEGLNSIRFFETLATGRIPVLVSDSCLLPFEDAIDYAGCSLRIAEADIPRAGTLIADWIAATGAERLLAMCRAARAAWERHFTAEQVLEQILSHLRRVLLTCRQSQAAAPTLSAAAQDLCAEEKDRAISLHERGELAAAGLLYDRLLAGFPDDAELYYLRGTLDLQLGNLTNAIVHLERAVRLQPEKAAYTMHLAIALQEHHRYDEAEQLLQALVRRHPAESDAWINLGVVLQVKGRLEESLTCFRRAESLAPNDPRAPQNAAAVYQAMGRFDDAERFLNRALILKPDYGTARWNLALLRLLQGDYPAGFADFAARFSKTNPVPQRHGSVPEWDGKPTPLPLLVWDEQGYGDAIQCCRYLPLVRKMVGRLFVECQTPALVDLLRTVAGVDGVYARGDVLPAFALQVPIMSLPGLFGTSLATVPADVPYLFAPAPAIARWQERLPAGASRIGLVWRGNPMHDNDANRSSSLLAFCPLITSSPATVFVSLQLQPTLDESRLLQELGVADPTVEIRSFSDTAALVMALDLVITVDTAVAHLAGALGKAVWLLLPQIPDWRWGVVGEFSPWYPTIRLFRQVTRGDWHTVVADVQRALAGLGLQGAPHRSVEDLLARAEAFREREAWADALGCYEAILAETPDSCAALLGAGGVLNFLNRHVDAARVYRQLLAIEPDNVSAHVNLGMSLLAAGELRLGWHELEWRLERVRGQLPPIPLLTENDVLAQRLAGKTVLLHTEQGYGDTLQFVRYASLLATEGARVVVSAQPEFGTLLQSCPGVSQVVPHGELLPAADYQAAMQSLPLVFATDLVTIPAAVPYLFPDPVRRRSWNARLAETPGLKVGLFWHGRQLGKSGYHRSIPGELLQPLTEVRQVTLFSLQIGEEQGQLSTVGLPIVDLGGEITDFSDTAAIIAELDLVISIDTSVAHLAGALGVPVWTLLLYAADWRWLTDRDDSPWYPTMRLFRQEAPGAWQGVINRVVQALQEKCRMLDMAADGVDT